LVDPNLDPRYYFAKANIRTPEFTPDDVIRIKDDANETMNFKKNTNYVHGRYDEALHDFENVHKLYPNLQIAKEMIDKCHEAVLTGQPKQ
jgi:hypothetical protein